ncbi:MAG: acyl--CoA ligase [Akkermansiaceae bacterium]|nr:acyl--CoA ligase [Akkermansiaceae bacterium]
MAQQTGSGLDWGLILDEQDPEKVAFRFGDEAFTCRQLGAATTALAGRFREEFAPGEIVAVWLPNCPEQLMACVAGFRAGIVPMPLPSEAKLPEVAGILRQSGCRQLIVSPRRHRAMSPSDLRGLDDRGVWAIDRDRLERVAGNPGARELPDLQSRFGDAAALVLHTSGTSCQPKGVVISRSALEHIIRGRIESAGIHRDSVAVVASSLAHSVGLYQALAFLAAGAGFDLLAGYDLRVMAERIQRCRPTHLIMVVAAFEKLLAFPALRGWRWDHLEFASVGADRVPGQLQKDFLARTGRTLAVSYGMTELSWILLNTSGQPGKSTSLGRPTPGVEVRLLGTDGEEVEDGEIGELAARSPKAMLGYLNDPDPVAGRMPDGWIMSGDLVRRDSDGDYWYVGRISDVIGLASGDLVSPFEVERELLGVPGIARCVVLGMPCRGGAGGSVSEVPWAVVVREDPAVTGDAIRDHLEARLSDYKLPRRIVFADEIPRGASGKVSRASLRRALMEGSAPRV